MKKLIALTSLLIGVNSCDQAPVLQEEVLVEKPLHGYIASAYLRPVHQYKLDPKTGESKIDISAMVRSFSFKDSTGRLILSVDDYGNKGKFDGGTMYGTDSVLSDYFHDMEKLDSLYNEFIN